MVSISFVLLKLMKNSAYFLVFSSIVLTFTCALNKNTYQLAPYRDLQLQDSLYFSMHLRDILKCNAYIHACAVCSFNDLTDDRTALYAHSFLCAYLLLCDQRVRRERCDG